MLLLITFLYYYLVSVDADGGCPDSDKCAAACKAAYPNLVILGGFCAGKNQKTCYCIRDYRQGQAQASTTQGTTK